MAESFDPATPDPKDFYYLREEYRSRNGNGLSSALRAFYSIKPVVPPAAQLAVRRSLTRRQRRRRFPAWPIEPLLIRGRARALATHLSARGLDRLPTVNPWPRGHRFAILLTHDVEGPQGLEQIPALLEIERRYGFVSSWNFVAEGYSVTDAVLEAVRQAGCEVGVHGITHDGRMFRDRASFERDVVKLRHYLDAWGAEGFRSPSTLRNSDWMHELPVRYDSSYPDTDPFQPQPGGCCWIFPFFFGEVVELPITLDQDHTLFVLLRERSIDRWQEKSHWIIENHGMINMIVHPDYMNAERLALYDQFLSFLSEQHGGWQTLPRELTTWWRSRSELSAQPVRSTDQFKPEDPGEASLAFAAVEGDRVVYATSA